ncbi:hypothetical protein G6F35_006679 [Rhizopus arrhizus]|nr:hypothetical protein G6F35_006679 [Rhizopus arrhizus]KAG1249152.1 hypothetical protein G6F68_013492 [Rhizopus microsporus]
MAVAINATPPNKPMAKIMACVDLVGNRLDVVILLCSIFGSSLDAAVIEFVSKYELLFWTSSFFELLLAASVGSYLLLLLLVTMGDELSDADEEICAVKDDERVGLLCE